jgi:hypothetical protein
MDSTSWLGETTSPGSTLRLRMMRVGAGLRVLELDLGRVQDGTRRSLGPRRLRILLGCLDFLGIYGPAEGPPALGQAGTAVSISRGGSPLWKFVASTARWCSRRAVSTVPQTCRGTFRPPPLLVRLVMLLVLARGVQRHPADSAAGAPIPPLVAVAGFGFRQLPKGLCQPPHID